MPNMTFKERDCRHSSQGKAKHLQRWQTWARHTRLWHVQLPLQLDMCLGKAAILKLPALRTKPNQSAEYVTQLVGLKRIGDFRHMRHNRKKGFALGFCSCQSRFAVGVVWISPVSYSHISQKSQRSGGILIICSFHLAHNPLCNLKWTKPMNSSIFL